MSSLAYSGRAPAGQEAGLFDQRYVWVREEGCELVSSFPVATPGVSMLPHCMKCVRGYSGMNFIDPRNIHAPSPLLQCSHVPFCSKFIYLFLLSVIFIAHNISFIYHTCHCKLFTHRCLCSLYYHGRCCFICSSPHLELLLQVGCLLTD